MIGQATTDLVRAALIAAVDEEPFRSDGRGQSLITVAKSYISQHLADPDLGAEAIARAMFISVRQVYKLWETEPRSLGQWILERRLDAARRELTSPRRRNQTIAAIAGRWGFVDATHFSRRFRQAYGVSPREWRHACADAAIPPGLSREGDGGNPRWSWRHAAHPRPVVSPQRLDSMAAGAERAFRSPPIVIGHGVGRTVAELLLLEASAGAAISLAPVPSGYPAVPTAAHLVGRRTRLTLLSVRGGPVAPTLPQFRQAIANESTHAEAQHLYQQHVTAAAPRNVLLQALRRRAVATTGRPRRGPLLLAAGGKDELIREMSTALLHRT